MRSVPERDFEMVALWRATQPSHRNAFAAFLAHGMPRPVHHQRRVLRLRKERAHLPAIRGLMRSQDPNGSPC